MRQREPDEVRVEQIGDGFAVQYLSRGEFRFDDCWVSIGHWNQTNKCVVFSQDVASRIVAALRPPAEGGR